MEGLMDVDYDRGVKLFCYEDNFALVFRKVGLLPTGTSSLRTLRGEVC